MDILDLRDYAMSLGGVEETKPFDETTLVYKVGGKMFLLCDMVDHSSMNVKCDPELAIDLRERYSEVTPGFHMNKRHWNTIKLDGDLPNSFIREQVLNSYTLVVEKLPIALRKEILELK